MMPDVAKHLIGKKPTPIFPNNKCGILPCQTCVMDYLRKKMGKPRACATCGKVLKNNWDDNIQYVLNDV